VGEHAVEGGQVLLHHLPAAAVVPGAHHRPAPVRHGATLVPHRSVPDGFALDLGVLGEQGPRHRNRQAELDSVADVIAGKAQPQGHRMAARPALHRHLAAAGGAAGLFRSGPQHRVQPALGGDGGGGGAGGGLCQQPQAAVQV
jgi:hypothetical protein